MLALEVIAVLAAVPTLLGGSLASASPPSAHTALTASPPASDDMVTEAAGLPGSFPVVFDNATKGAWSDKQIYITIIGQASPGQWSYLRPDGSAVHINHLDATAPGHLTKHGVDYPDMSFTLAQRSTVEVPPDFQGGRIYVSLGSPLYIAVTANNGGWAGPDPVNPSDPNADVYYDWYEFTYDYGSIPFGGNTTEVDMFGLPLAARLQQASSGYDKTLGITLSRSKVYADYRASVGAAFLPLAGMYRILSPGTSLSFAPGGPEAGYLRGRISAAWSYYTNHRFELNQDGVRFAGQVQGGQLHFTENGQGPYVLSEPTTTDVVQCSGALASVGMSTPELQLGADFCAAFNRGVALHTSEWSTASDYYPGGAENDYAKFFHTVAIDGLAYGFPYDDVNGQSSVAILSNARPPTSLRLEIGW